MHQVSSTQRRFSLIVAVDSKNGIGKEGKLPWSLRKELMNCIRKLNFRKDKSMRNGWMWGRKSYIEYVKPQKSKPERRSIAMLTKDKKKFEASNAKTLEDMKELVVFESFDAALNAMSQDGSIENIWICGGESVYKQAVSHAMCEKIYITRIFKEYGCDQFFPKIDTSKYKMDDSFTKDDEEKETKFQFQLYNRI